VTAPRLCISVHEASRDKLKADAALWFREIVLLVCAKYWTHLTSECTEASVKVHYESLELWEVKYTLRLDRLLQKLLDPLFVCVVLHDRVLVL